MLFSSIKRKVRQNFRKLNKVTERLFTRSYFKAFILLNIIASINFYSVGSKREFWTHLCVLIVGVFGAVVVSNVKYEWIKKAAISLYIFVFGLVVLVNMIGAKVNGARRWLKVGFFMLQPSEFLKIALILIIAFYLQERLKPNSRQSSEYNLVDLFIPLTLTIIPLIVVLGQPDLGTAIICLIITGSILFFMGIEKKTLIFIFIICCSCGMIGWKHLRPYQKERIISFLNPDVDYRGKAWQSHQSLIAFGSGGIFGRGTKKGPETQLGYLPERETDFALASIAEEHGFVFVIIILALINFIVTKLLFIAQNARDRFSAVLTIGIAFWIGYQAIINTLMVISLMPVVGIPFPCISYGGSSLLALILSIGIVANIEHKKLYRG